MDWNSSTKLLFIILFLLKGIDATSPPDKSSKYDITKILNDSLAGIFGGIDLNKKIKLKTSNVGKEGCHKSGVPLENTQIRSFSDKISIEYFMFLYCIGYQGLQLRSWHSSKNEMNISYNVFKFDISGAVTITQRGGTLRCDYEANFLSCDNLTITANNQPENHNEHKKIQINASLNNLVNEGTKLRNCHQLPYKQQLKLIHTISQAFPTIIRDCIIDVGNPAKLANDILSFMNPKEKISSVHSDFLENEQHYYYRIPDIYFVHVHLRNIKIIGLWNFEPYQHNYKSSVDTPFTLRVKNITGNMILDPGFEHLPIFRLKFVTDELSLIFDQITEGMRVMAKNYSIAEDTSTPSTQISSWLAKYSDFIMGHILSAIETFTIPPTKGIEDRRNLSSSRTINEMETMLIQLLEKSTNN